jgi:hypothetical protein
MDIPNTRNMCMTADIPRYDLLYLRGDFIIIPLRI